MNRQFIRERFKSYRQRNEELEQQIRDMLTSQKESDYYQHEARTRAEKRLRACRAEEEERRNREESDRWYREGQMKDAIADLDRARRYGDEYGIEKATRKLKSIY